MGEENEGSQGCIYNKKLPYTSLIEDEHQLMYNEIREGLCESIRLQELAPGTAFWIRRLNEFLVIHKTNIPRPELIQLCQMLYEIVTIPDLDFNLQDKFACLLTKIIQKEKVLPSECMELPWRPLYDIMVKAYFSSTRSCVYARKDRHGDAMYRLIDESRRFFPETATEEIMTEVMPLLCSHDVSLFRAQGFLSMFLPTTVREGKKSKHDLWLDELIKTWSWIEKMEAWDLQWLILFERLAVDNLGKIDWSPYIPVLFTKCLDILNLPVGSSGSHHPTQQQHMPSACNALLPDIDRLPFKFSLLCSLLVSLITPTSGALEELDQLLHAIELFFHPSNTGHWTIRLARLMSGLCYEMAHRIQLESLPDCKVPVESRLTPVETRSFVKMMMPVLFLSLFAKSPSSVLMASQSFKYVAYIAPDLVFPALLERIYPALQTLTETHQTVSALGCLSFVSRPLLTRSLYPEGATHLLNLLTLTLPGVDPNDTVKTEATLKFYCSVLTCVPMVDCSNINHTGMAERDIEVCESTALFEEWAMQFLDRIFLVCENYLEPVKRGRRTVTSALEATFLNSLRTTCILFFTQLSPSIHAEASSRVFRFITSNLLMKALKPVGHICAAASMTSPHTNLHRFLPFLVDRILDASTRQADDTDDAPIANKELMWDLHMVLQVIKMTGLAMLPYSDMLISVIDASLYSRNRVICKLGAKLLRNMLRSLTTIYPKDLNSIGPDELSDPTRMYTMHWGDASKSDALQVDWHVPTRDEIAFAHRLLRLFLEPSIAKLKCCLHAVTKDSRKILSSAEISQHQYDLWQNLVIIRNVRVGAGIYVDNSLQITPSDDAKMTDWEEATQGDQSQKSMVRMYKYRLPVHVPIDTHGLDVRQYDLAGLLHDIQTHLITVWEDDTKLLRLLCKAVHAVLCPGARDTILLYNKKRMYSASKLVLSSLMEPKQHVRMILVTRAYIQHLARTSRNRLSAHYTPQHLTLIRDMLVLATNVYEDVQKKAQSILISALRCYASAKYEIFNDVLSYLKAKPLGEQTDSHAEQVKGAIYVLQSKTFMHLITQSWSHMKAFIMALIQCQSVDRPAIQSLVSKLFIIYSLEFYTLSICMNVTQPCIAAADKLMPSNPLDKQRLEESVKRLQERNDTNLEIYTTFNEELATRLSTGSLHWRYELMMSSCLIYLLRPDSAASPAVVKWFLRCLISELSPMRKIAMKALGTIFANQKHSADGKMRVNLGYSENGQWSAINYGVRANSAPYVYKEDKMPRTHNEWINCQFVDKNFVGWSTYAPTTVVYQADKGVCRPHEMTESERLVQEAFTASSYVNQVISFMDIEDNNISVDGRQGRGNSDSFNENYARMFKGLFRNDGIAVFTLMLPHLERMCASTDKFSHKTAAEIIAGAMRGSKHWLYDDTVKLWAILCPLLQTTLFNISNGLASEWTACIHFCVYDRDPRRISWLTDLVFKMPLVGDEIESAATEGHKLQLWQTVLQELSWRGLEPTVKLLDHLRGFLDHPYKLVREQIARSLYVIFKNIWVPNTQGAAQTAIVQSFVGEVKNHIVGTCRRGMDEDQRTQATKYFNTVLSWLTITFHAGGAQYLLPYISHIFPIVFTIVDCGRDEQLLNLAKQCVMYASHIVFPANQIGDVVDSLYDQANVLGWHGLLSVITFIQGMVFRNLFQMNTQQIIQLVELLITLMANNQLEVRVLAARTIGGIVRCDKRCSQIDLHERFRALAKTPITRVKGQVSIARTPDAINRHVGQCFDIMGDHRVLGMAALVEAYPYDVPTFLPSLLVELGEHIADPVPISTTVKRTLSEFWRTHQDNWNNLKENFTDDQLEMVTDLLISPSYYA